LFEVEKVDRKAGVMAASGEHTCSRGLCSEIKESQTNAQPIRFKRLLPVADIYIYISSVVLQLNSNYFSALGSGVQVIHIRQPGNDLS